MNIDSVICTTAKTTSTSKGRNHCQRIVVAGGQIPEQERGNDTADNAQKRHDAERARDDAEDFAFRDTDDPKPDEGKHAVAQGDQNLAAKIAHERNIDLGNNGDDFLAQLGPAHRYQFMPVIGDLVLVGEEIVDVNRHKTKAEQEPRKPARPVPLTNK